MLARTGIEENTLRVRVALDVLGDPREPIVASLAKEAGLDPNARTLEDQLDERIEELWPMPAPGELGMVSPYLLEVAEDKEQVLWCRRGKIPPPEAFVRSVVRFGGIYQPIHYRDVGPYHRVVAGRKRRSGVMVVNHRRFLEWADAHYAYEVPTRLIATLPALHLTLDMDVCEDIACDENISHFGASKTDLAFWTLRKSAKGELTATIAEQLGCSVRTIENYLTLGRLCDEALEEVQFERVSLTAGYRLAQASEAEQKELLKATAKLTPSKRSRAILEALGAAQASPAATQRAAWVAGLEGQGDPVSVAVAAVLRFQAGDRKALEAHPMIRGIFEQAGEA
jgi:hypothetical protein